MRDSKTNFRNKVLRIPLAASSVLFAGCIFQSNAKRDIDPQESRAKIIGGTAVLKETFKSSVYLGTSCSATVVSEWHLLTAGHCVRRPGAATDLIVENDKLRISSFSAGNDFNGHREKFDIHVSRTIIHPDWLKLLSGSDQGGGVDTWPSDLAIIELKETIPLPVSEIAAPPTNLKGKRVVLVGAGCQQLGGAGGSEMRFAPLLVQSVEKFSYILDPSENVTKSGSTACAGDSGGGTFLADTNGNAILGGKKVETIVAVNSTTSPPRAGEPADTITSTIVIRLDVPSVATWLSDSMSQSTKPKEKAKGLLPGTLSEKIDEARSAVGRMPSKIRMLKELMLFDKRLAGMDDIQKSKLGEILLNPKNLAIDSEKLIVNFLK